MSFYLSILSCRAPCIVQRSMVGALLGLLLSACAVGPDYKRPELDIGAQYKEGAAEFAGWKPAQPKDAAERSQWWRLYGDTALNTLMDQLNIANQDIAQAEANYRQAQTLVSGSRAGFFPTLGTDAGVTRSGSGAKSSDSGVSNQYSLSANAGWELDVWGRVRRGVEATQASAQASAADLAGARLSAQATLAQTYFQLRIQDEQIRLLNATLLTYERSLQLIQNRYDAGVTGKADVVVARTQLENARVQVLDAQWQRAQYEHALAVLTGQAPLQFALAPAPEFLQEPPMIPAGLPSQLLERRPDVAASERRVAQANAEIGVAQAAWFPDLTLSANGGFRNGQFSQWLTAPAQYWSLGPALALTVFDGGARQAQLDKARAGYDAQVASYRQTVLVALREVEDYLIQLRIQEQEQVVQSRALESARESLQLTLNQYKEGMVDYLSVAGLEAVALSSERNTLNLIGTRLTTSVQLIAALGGGWEGLPDLAHDSGADLEPGLIRFLSDQPAYSRYSVRAVLARQFTGCLRLAAQREHRQAGIPDFLTKALPAQALMARMRWRRQYRA
jgi:NodT family efflux transporter outer membrane factor (OMF) lipoprotein